MKLLNLSVLLLVFSANLLASPGKSTHAEGIKPDSVTLSGHDLSIGQIVHVAHNHAPVYLLEAEEKGVRLSLDRGIDKNRMIFYVNGAQQILYSVKATHHLRNPSCPV